MNAKTTKINVLPLTPPVVVLSLLTNFMSRLENMPIMYRSHQLLSKI